MEQVMEQIFALLIQNFSDIGTAGTLIFLIYYIVSQHGKSSSRDDDFRTELLRIHSKALDISSNHGELLTRHTEEAKTRYQEQAARDKDRMEIAQQQTNALTKITDHLDVVESTKIAVDNIRAAQVVMEGSVTHLGTDMTALVNQRADGNLAEMKKAIETSFQLVEKALLKMQPRLDGIATLHEDNVVSQGERHAETMNKQDVTIAEIQALTMNFETLHNLMKNMYLLVEQKQTLSTIQPLPDVDDTVIPEPNEDKKDIA